MFLYLPQVRPFRILALALFLALVVVYFHYDPNEIDRIPKRDRMDLAWQYEFDITRDPKTMTVPRERLQVAREYMMTLQANKNRMAAPLSGIVWSERGPANVSGRTRSMLVSSLDPSGKTVFAAGVGGGIWKCTDITAGTPVWTPVNDFFSNLAITSIAQDPSNGQIIYFGTGEGWSNADAIRGDGIWKSTDGGTSFTQMAGTASNANFYYINKVVVHPSTGDVYAATNSGLFRYTILTSTWTKVLGAAAGASINQIADVEIAADGAVVAATGVIFAGADGIYRSTSGNLGTYTRLNTGSNGFPSSGFARLELALAPSNSAVMYVMAHSSSNDGLLNIYKTIDTGANWSTCSRPVDADPGIGNDLTRGQAWYDLALAVDPSNANKLIAGGIDLFRSSDGGSSWSQLSHWYGLNGMQYIHADQHSITFRNSNEVYFTNDGGLYRSTNGGTNITFAGDNYNVTQYYGCAINPTLGSNQFMAGAQDNGTQQYSSPGINNTLEVTGGDGAFCHIDQSDPNLQFSAYVYNSIYRSTNGGGSFSSIRSDGTGSFINPSDFDNNSKVFYGAYDFGQYTRLLNAGTSTTWTNITISAFNAAKVSAVSCSPVTANRVFFGTRGGRVVRVNGANGASPTGTVINGGSTGFPINTSTTISCIAIQQNNDNHLLVTVSNYGVTSVYETLNGGTNWTNVEGNLPDMPIRWALFNPDDSSSALVATELGVWSTDELQSTSTVWGPSNTGMANVRTDMLKMRSSDNMVIAATHGRGLYSTDYFAPAYPEFTADPLVIYTNKPIQFSDGSVKATSWSWDFGDATTSTAQNPVKSYANAGFYTVTLKINNNNSLQKVRTSYIHVLPDRGTPYTPATGGNFDMNGNDFGATQIGTGTAWMRGVSSISDKSGTRSGSFAYVTNITTNYGDNSTAYLYTPNFNCTAAGTYTLRFYRKNRFETGYDGYYVEYSLNKGDTWTTLGSVGANWYDYTNAASGAFNIGQTFFNGANPSSFVLAQRDVSFLAGNSNVCFRFVFKSDESVNAAGVAIDDFELMGPNNTQLPVTLGTFTGTRKGSDNLLQWNTFSEVDNKGFFIERSFNGYDFDNIGFAKGAGTTTVYQAYSFTDQNVPPGTTYYRLRQVDFNGDYAYSKTIALTGSNKPDEWVKIFPVPVQSNLNLLFQDIPKEPVSITLYNVAGSLQMKKKLNVSGGALTLPLDEYALPQGVYFISIEADGRRFSERFVKY